MRLYLVQHGEAIPEDLDPERPLTERGRSDVQALASFIAGSDVPVAAMVHSGKLRARDTAAMIADAIGFGGTQQVLEKGLLPKDSPVYFTETIATWTKDTLVVGHEPFMSRLVSRLVLGMERPSIVDISPGTLVCLARRPVSGAWFVAWMVTPDLLRRGR